MRHLILSLCLILAPVWGACFEIEEQIAFGSPDARQTLKVISTTDASVFAPLIMTFLADAPDLRLEYIVASSAELQRAIYEESIPFDIAISSAMDLQTKLANDGYALPHTSKATAALPEWARWRDDLFAFTQEPAAFVLSRAHFAGLDMPRTRQELITLLRQHPDRFRGRVGTYDLRSSGLGYLFATQDSRTSESFWRLTEVMGAADARLYCCSSDMIDDVARGELAIAYNALGSYAVTRQDAATFEIIQPSDFTTVMMRTVLIPHTAPQPDLAGQFVDYLLQIAWSDSALEHAPFGGTGLLLKDRNLRRIPLGPGLLVFLDRLKRSSFLSAWESAILQNLP